jgi:type II secretion system protein C
MTLKSLPLTTVSAIDFSARAIWVLGKIAIFFAVGMAITARQKLDYFNQISPVQTETPHVRSDDRGNESMRDSQLEKIIKRDIFNSIEKEKKPVADEAKKKKSDLGFRLVGTSITPGKSPFAIIENKQKSQDVFETSEKIFEIATLKEIHTDHVVLERDGAYEVLEVEGGTRDPSESSIRSSGTEFVVPEDEVTEALSNLPKLLSEARAVPYFRNGESIGMRLYAIKSGSLYEKLGLKNSDVIREINNKPVNDPSKALKLFEDLKSERSISVSVERSGEDIQLQYQIR